MFNLILIGLVVTTLLVIGLYQFINYRKQINYMEDAASSMVSAKQQEMRQRFLKDGDDMEYTFLVLSEKGAGETLKQAWRELADNYPETTRQRLWALQLQLASAPMFIAGEGERHLVWAVVRVGREAVSVKVRCLEPSMLAPSLRAVVSDTANDLVGVLKKRKLEVSIAAVKTQPELASLTVVPII